MGVFLAREDGKNNFYKKLNLNKDFMKLIKFYNKVRKSKTSKDK